MAIGMIITCDKCGESYDSGKTSFHMCNPINVSKKERRDKWNEMTTDEKLDFLKDRIDEVEGNIPYHGPIG